MSLLKVILHEVHLIDMGYSFLLMLKVHCISIRILKPGLCIYSETSPIRLYAVILILYLYLFTP
ncbi:hypothetical protein C2G38_1423703 [Gigaspora rosea]|uniref:Uncharacterized protein n=1 Tax=Gigaspora rosea TaxID=44941 RepID=A0A397W7Q1_9GLOM|nr:hypothetical protein C2G38_1423703 [Gigaspora rosea]